MTDFQCSTFKNTLSFTIFGRTVTVDGEAFSSRQHGVKNDSGPFRMSVDFLCGVSSEESVNGVARAETFSSFRRRGRRWVAPNRKSKKITISKRDSATSSRNPESYLLLLPLLPSAGKRWLLSAEETPVNVGGKINCKRTK